VEHRVHWWENGRARRACWLSGHHATPAAIVVAGDELRADHALTIARQGGSVLWRGDYRNARQLLGAMRRRLERRPPRAGDTPAETFHRHRQATADRVRLINRLLVELGPGHALDLPHAPDVAAACTSAYGPSTSPTLVPLAELFGVLGAHQWRLRGIWVPALDNRIHPHYGVFAPTRQEYLDLVSSAPWPARVATALDIGTGTGVLAAILARRGAKTVVATDIEPRAVACARDNVARLGLRQVSVEHTDLFPDRRADLVVCNPPWLPATPASPLDAAVYDKDSRVLRHFLRGLPQHLKPGGEAWLVTSDLAERLGLRPGMATMTAGLRVVDRLDTRPRHRLSRPGDPLSVHRAAEITSLWRLSVGTD
jgi:SAM-dependent methyltransferase